MKSIHLLTITIASLAAVPFAAQAQNALTTPVEITLAGTTKYDGWYNLTSTDANRVIHGVATELPGVTGYPGYPGAAAWPSPIDSQLHSGSNAELDKTGNIFPAGSSLYAGGSSFLKNNPTAGLSVIESNPVSDLQSIVFQVQTGTTWGFDFYNSSYATSADIDDGPAASRNPGLLSSYSSWAPSLVLNFADDTQTAPILPTNAALLNRDYMGETGFGESWINLYGFQWDLSSYSDILSFSIEWDVVQHSQTHGLQLDQSSVFDGEVLSNHIAVPEPGTYAAVFGSVLVVGLLIRRSSGSKA